MRRIGDTLHPLRAVIESADKGTLYTQLGRTTVPMWRVEAGEDTCTHGEWCLDQGAPMILEGEDPAVPPVGEVMI